MTVRFSALRGTANAGYPTYLQGFPEDARRRAGFELSKVQRGLEPSDWKPFPAIGPGVVELRIHTAVEHRVIYVAKFEEGVYVLHAFEKRSRQPRQADVELAKTRLRDVLRRRRSTASSRA